MRKAAYLLAETSVLKLLNTISDQDEHTYVEGILKLVRNARENWLKDPP